MSLLLGIAICASPAAAEVIPADGYIYNSQLMSELTEGCVAQAPGGLFVGMGPVFPAYPAPAPPGTRSISFVTASGDTRVVATGFNALTDCVYDWAADVLYVVDNGGDFASATTGDTVYALPAASTAEGLSAGGNELVPSGAVPFGASIAQDAAGDIYVSDAAGGDAGSVIKISGGVAAPFISGGFDYTGGLAFNFSGDLAVAEALEPGFDSQVRLFSAAGAPLGPLSSPGYDHGSIDAAFDASGSLLLTGSPALASVDANGVATSLVGFPSFTFGGSVSVDAFTGRIDFLASTFTGADEDASVHSLVPVARLVAGRGAPAAECVVETYGVGLVPRRPGAVARNAICTDGELCDGDGTVNDECLFPLGFCLNVSDPELPTCTAAEIADFTVRARPAAAAIDDLAVTIRDALPLSESACFFSDGVRVPVTLRKTGAKRRGRAALRVLALRDSSPARDSDLLRLFCEPAAG